MAVGTYLDLFLDVVPLVGAGLSLAASAYMVLLLMRLPRPSRQRLLLRQLLHLSFANLLFSAAEVVGQALELLVWSGWKGDFLTHDEWRYVCITVNTPGIFGAVASMLFECHLALAFTASILRYGGTLGILSWCLAFLWPLALILAAGEVVSVSDKHTETHRGGYFWDIKQQHACAMEHGNVPDVSYMLITVLFCIACYLVCTCNVCMAGMSVQRRVWGRAQTYPLMAVITLVPTIAYNVVPIKWLKSDEVNYWFSAVATLSRNLSGVVYFAFYSLNTRYVRHAHRDEFHGVQNDVPPGDTKEHSFRVNFREVASVVEIAADSLLRTTPSSVCSDTPPHSAASVLSPNLPAEDENQSLLISYYMDSWTGLNSGVGRRWGVVDEHPDRPPAASRSPMSSTLRSDLSRSR